jgi:hypothetical protein
MTKVLTLNTSGLIIEQDISLVYSLVGTAVIDFGIENDSSSLIVNTALITNSNIKGYSFLPQETTETSLDDFSLNGVSFTVEKIIDNVSFAIRGTAINSASGNYTLKYLITY